MLVTDVYPGAVDLLLIRAGLAARAAEVAVALLGVPNRALSNRRQLRFHNKGSLQVDIAGRWAGRWYDHELGRHGGLFDLVQRETGCDFSGALKWAINFLGGLYTAPIQPTPAPVAADDTAPNQNQDRGLAIWRESRSIVDTPAATYLDRRRVLGEALAAGSDVLRFHGHCPYGGNGARHPCLIALLRDVITNEPKAIVRTALTPDGTKVGGRKALGPVDGAAIKLSADEDVAEGLHIGEGLESVLSAMARGLLPAWALGGAGNMAAFPVLSGVEALIIIVDHDLSGTGQRAALECSERWIASGREVRVMVPSKAGSDFNNITVQQQEKKEFENGDSFSLETV
jgi:putative DNA primase/helicase